MSFDTSDIDKNFSNDILKSYTFNIDVHQSNIVSSKYDSYYQINYDNGLKISLNINGQTYTATTGKSIYFFGNILHDNIKGFTDFNGKYTNDLIGELLINASDGLNDIYICYFISKVDANVGSATDSKNGSISILYKNIITNGQSPPSFYYSDNLPKITVTKTINPLIDGTIPAKQDNGCIVYKVANNPNNNNNDSYVIVFLNPITISDNNIINFISALNSKNYPITKYPSGGDIDIITKQVIETTNSGKSGNSGTSSNPKKSVSSSNPKKSESSSNPNSKDQIYIECTPTGTSGDLSPNIQIPLSSDIMQNIQNSSFAQLCSNMSLFCVILLLCYMSIPTIYKMVISKMGEEEKVNSIYFIMLILFTIILGLFIDFQNTHDINELTISFFLLFLNILIFILTLGQEDELPRYDFQKFLIFISGVIVYLFTSRVLIFWIFCIIITLIILIILTNIKNKNGDNIISSYTRMGHILTWVSLTIIPVFVGLITYIFPSNSEKS